MQKEFLLTPAQTAAIRKLHEAYEPVCAEHCLRIQKSRTELAAATDANTRAAIQADLDRFSRICHDSTLAHLRQVAALMPPGQGRRFLALTEPKLETTEHVQPLGLK